MYTCVFHMERGFKWWSASCLCDLFWVLRAVLSACNGYRWRWRQTNWLSGEISLEDCKTEEVSLFRHVWSPSPETCSVHAGSPWALSKRWSAVLTLCKSQKHPAGNIIHGLQYHWLSFTEWRFCLMVELTNMLKMSLGSVTATAL